MPNAAFAIAVSRIAAPRISGGIHTALRSTPCRTIRQPVRFQRAVCSVMTSQQPFSYPAVPRDDSVIETLHGVAVADPYRALEDPDASATTSFCEAQNNVTQDYLSRGDAFRTKAKEEIENMMNYNKYGIAWKEGDYFYYGLHEGLANQSVIYQCDAVDSDEARVFIDPNLLSEDGTASLGRMSFSDDGKYCAYGVQRSGSDWADIYLIDCETLEKQPDVLEWAKFYSIAWTNDNAGFYYSRYPAPASLAGSDRDKRGAETDEALDQAVYYHKIGSPQKEDRLVIAADPENRKYMYGLDISTDGAYLIITIAEDCAPRNLWWYVDLKANFGKEGDNIVKFVNKYEASFSYIGNDDSLFYLETNLDAPRNKVIAVDLADGGEDRSKWRVVVPEHPKDVLNSVRIVHQDKLVLVYMQDASERLYLHKLATGERIEELPLPDLGAVSIWGRRKYDFLTFSFSSFLYPGTVYHCDLTKPGKEGMRVFRQMKPPGFNASLYSTKQVWYDSKDGTKVPMFVIGPKDDLPGGEKRPVLLYGYGGFCISMTPYFSMRFVSWLQALGGIVVVANLRGGSEFGDDWHNAGIVDKKQNVFDDFQWAAKALQGPELNIAEAGKTCIMGGSNGGLLVGACVNQAPELYGAAVAQVGVMDMVRFSKFTIGSAWVSDFGDPDKADEFEHLFKYSPLHNTFSPAAKGKAYPAVLLTTGSHDDRVVPLHSHKFAATLQHRVTKSAKDIDVQGDAPILLRVDVKAGHGAGKPTAKVIDEMADTLCFAALALDVVPN